MNNQVTMQLTIDSIYSFSLTEVELTGDKEFSIEIFNGKIISILSGRRKSSNLIISIEDKGLYKIKFEIIDWIFEKSILDEAKETQDKSKPYNYYGMRYYPFISSHIQTNFKIINGFLRALTLITPNYFRLIWYGSDIIHNETNKATINHSFSSDKSKYIFIWQQQSRIKQENLYKIKLPIRLSGSKILKLVNFPFFYWLLALIVIALAAFQDKPSLLAAAIAGTWTFMLRQWTNSDAPMRNTLLTFGYVVAGLVLMIWGILLKLFHFKAFILLIPILIFYRYFNLAIREYGVKGSLPSFITNYWSKKIHLVDIMQKKSWLSKHNKS